MLHSHVLYIELDPLGKTEQAWLSLSVYPIGWKEFREFCHNFMIPPIDPMIRVDDSCEIWKELFIVFVKMAGHFILQFCLSKDLKTIRRSQILQPLYS